MKTQQVTLAQEPKVADTVVVIDVCRAFTTAAFALAGGVQRLYLVGTVEEGFNLREAIPGSLLAGEVNGLPVPGFDLWNSPAQFTGSNLAGKTLILRTSAGTQGVIRYQRAKALFAAGFATARATVRAVRLSHPEQVTFVVTGVKPGDAGSEDIACADYMQALLVEKQVAVEPYLRASRKWNPGRITQDAALLADLERDLALCLQADRFNFAMRVVRLDGRLALEKFMS